MSRSPERRTNFAVTLLTCAADEADEDSSGPAAAADVDDVERRSLRSSQTVESWSSSAGRRPPQPPLSGNRRDKSPTIRQWRRSTPNSTRVESCHRSEGVRQFRSYNWKSIQFRRGLCLDRTWPHQQVTKCVACSPLPLTKQRAHHRHLPPSRRQVLRRGRTSRDAGSFQTDPPTDHQRSRMTQSSRRRPKGAKSHGG